MFPRALRPLPVALLLLHLGACNDEPTTTEEAAKGGVEEMSIVVEADKSRILEEEQSLEKKKQSFEEEQSRLERERSEVAEKLASLSKKDKSARAQLEADQKRLQDEEDRLRSRLRSFEQERDKLEQDKTKLLEKIAKLEQPKGAQSMPQREESMAQRERGLAKREAELALREKAVAEREGEVGKALREAQQLLASLGAAPRTVVVNQVAAPSGGTATAASVQNLRKDVTRKMDGRGLLMDDLPPTARDLDQEAKNALKNKDYQAAADALTKLGSIVDGTVINSAFVQGKMTRINRTYSGAKLDTGTKAQIQKLLSEFSELATDGRWDGANRKANQMLTVYQSK